MGNVIEFENVYKIYSGFGLTDVNFSVPEGLCCGFVGPNGAGKTTTLRIMTGMAFHDSGEVQLFGRPNTDISIKEDVGILIDRPCFQEAWTPLDIEKACAPFIGTGIVVSIISILHDFSLTRRRDSGIFHRG